MSAALVAYLAVGLVVMVAAAACLRIEKRRSDDPALRPALDGLVAGTCWPLLAVVVVFVGFVVALAWLGARIVNLVEVGS